jgi:hypothetical protein
VIYRVIADRKCCTASLDPVFDEPISNRVVAYRDRISDFVYGQFVGFVSFLEPGTISVRSVPLDSVRPELIADRRTPGVTKFADLALREMFLNVLICQPFRIVSILLDAVLRDPIAYRPSRYITFLGDSGLRPVEIDVHLLEPVSVCVSVSHESLRGFKYRRMVQYLDY